MRHEQSLRTSLCATTPVSELATRYAGAPRFTRREIAEMLSLSDKTVSTYRGRILEKLQLKTTADLVRYALDHSLIA